MNHDQVVANVIESLSATFPVLREARKEEWKQRSLESYVDTLLGRAHSETIVSVFPEAHRQLSAMNPRPSERAFRNFHALEDHQTQLMRVFQLLAEKCGPSLIDFLPPEIDREEFEQATEEAIAKVTKRGAVPADPIPA